MEKTPLLNKNGEEGLDGGCQINNNIQVLRYAYLRNCHYLYKIRSGTHFIVSQHCTDLEAPESRAVNRDGIESTKVRDAIPNSFWVCIA